MVKKLNVGAALLAGFVATGAMTLLMYMAPLMGLPKMDLLFALGSLFPGQLSPYILGAIVHIGIGSALALLYALFFAPLLPGPRWARGALYSVLPWLLAIYAMGPMLTMVQSWSTPAMASQVMNPCAVVNPCGAVTRPANPCAVRPAVRNPCAPTSAQAVNPCGAMASAEQQAAASPAVTRLMSLLAHLVLAPRSACCIGRKGTRHSRETRLSCSEKGRDLHDGVLAVTIRRLWWQSHARQRGDVADARGLPP